MNIIMLYLLKEKEYIMKIHNSFKEMTEKQLNTWQEIVTDSMFSRRQKIHYKINKFYKKNY